MPKPPKPRESPPTITDGVTTEAAVRAILAPDRYRFSRMGHVLLCEPG